MDRSIQESFFGLGNAVKIQLLEAVRYGHVAASQGKSVEWAVAHYAATRAIFTEIEKGT